MYFRIAKLTTDLNGTLRGLEYENQENNLLRACCSYY